MFNLFKKNIHAESISHIENEIKLLPSFRYFQKSNSNLLIVYKEFEISIIASAIYKYLYYQKQGQSNFNEVNEEIKKIYFKRVSTFLRDQILTGNLFFDFSSTYSIPSESQVILSVYVKFNDYFESIRDSFKEELPFWVEELEKPDYDEDLDFNISGVKHYYPYILNLLLSEIKENDRSQKYIDTLKVWEIDEEAYELFKAFVLELKSIKI